MWSTFFINCELVLCINQLEAHGIDMGVVFRWFPLWASIPFQSAMEACALVMSWETFEIWWNKPTVIWIQSKHNQRKHCISSSDTVIMQTVNRLLVSWSCSHVNLCVWAKPFPKHSGWFKLTQADSDRKHSNIHSVCTRMI